jgi:DNA processing protein
MGSSTPEEGRAAEACARSPAARVRIDLAWAQLEALGVRPRHRGTVDAAGGAVALLARPPSRLAAWLNEHVPRRGPALDASVLGARLARVQRVVRPFVDAGGVLIGGDDEAAQRRLARAPDPRLVLFGVGPREVLDAPRSVAIVGTRRASERARRRARSLAEALSAQGVVVVSGGADGVDRAAHDGALDAGGSSIEVVGERLAAKAPGRHGRLSPVAGRLLKLVVFGPGEAQGAWLFARRNRFIAAAADALVVVEGDERSGARYAAEAALALGLPVRVFPGDVDDPCAGLANKLLAETDARPMRTVGELLDAAGGRQGQPGRRRPPSWQQRALPLSSSPSPTTPAPEALPPLLAALVDGPLTVDELAPRLGCGPAQVQRQALEWELRGRLVRRGARLQLACD